MSDDVGAVATGAITYNDGRLSAVATALRVAAETLTKSAARSAQFSGPTDATVAMEHVADAFSQAVADIEAAGVLPFPTQGGE